MKNSEDKIVINYDDITQYYDLYVNGLNVVASGSLYLTGGNTDLFLSEDPIIVNGVDSGKTGVEYDFDVISEYCLKVSQFQPNGPGELDFIFVSNNKLYQLSEMYNYGYHKILVETEENFIFNNATIVTLPATEITSNSVVLNASLVDDLPGSLVTETGFNWGTSPDNLDNTIVVGNSVGEFSLELNDFDSQTTYYFQVYASNGNTVKLGNVLSFTTEADFNNATVVTLPATEITSNSVVLNATLVDDLPGSLVTETGFNWSTDPNNLSNTESVGNSVGDFSLELIDLDPQTTYYYRAYATDGTTTLLGEILSSETEAEITTDGRALMVGSDGYYACSLDHGHTWTVGDTGNQNWKGCSLLSDGHALMVGFDGYYAYSSDYGNTWTIKDTGRHDWRNCDLLPDGHALMVSPGRYYAYSSDYGHTWTIKANSSSPRLYGCSLLPDGHAIMVGDVRYYAYSSDYGHTRTDGRVGTNTWHSCSLLSDGLALMVGFDGYYAYSSDYGHTWTVRNLGAYTWIDCSLLPDGHAIMVGEGGYYAYSSDYGHTWTVRRVGTNNWLNCPLLSDGRALMVGSDGSYAYSSDYGNTWTMGDTGNQTWVGCSMI